MIRTIATVALTGLSVTLLTAPSVAQPAKAPPPAQSVWIQSSGSTWQMLRMWKNG